MLNLNLWEIFQSKFLQDLKGEIGSLEYTEAEVTFSCLPSQHVYLFHLYFIYNFIIYCYLFIFGNVKHLQMIILFFFYTHIVYKIHSVALIFLKKTAPV